MTEYTISYFVSFLPILLGISVMYLLRRFNPSNDKIKITTTDFSPFSKKQPDDNTELIPITEATGMDPKDLIFKNYIYDMLLIEGLIKHPKNNDLDYDALCTLGILNLDKISQLYSSLGRMQTEKLSLFTSPGFNLESLILPFNGKSSVILNYLINYNLEIVFSGDV